LFHQGDERRRIRREQQLELSLGASRLPLGDIADFSEADAQLIG
jgi:hypothetical protein